MTTIGERIKAYRTQLGLNQKQLAEKCSAIDTREKSSRWGQSRIGNYETDARMPDLEDIRVLGVALNVEPQALAFDKNVSIIKIKSSFTYPLLSAIQASTWTETYDYSDSTGYEYLETDIEASENAFFLKIVGFSMRPKFSDGDIVLIDPNRYPHPGDYVAAVNGIGEATFKLYKELGEISESSGRPHFELEPLNSVFPTLSTLKQDIRIIGVAVEHRSYL